MQRKMWNKEVAHKRVADLGKEKFKLKRIKDFIAT
jgi:hypothetical protein